MQVCINIIKNSKDALVRSGKKDKKIHIGLKKETDYLLISICDNGGGIKDAIIDKIFTPYFTTKSEKNGTGLGLYMSETIINKHLNGSIEAKNFNDGVCFNIRLPWRQQ